MSYARELSIVYGSTTVGGNSTKFLLTDVHTLRVGFAVSVVEFSFVVTGSSASNFASNCSEAETAFRTPDQDLVISQASSTLLSLKQSENTGLDAMPVIVKRGDVADTGRSRLYVVRIELGMPGNRASVEGLRQDTVSVAYDASRRRHVTISGEFTAFSGTAARAQYESKIEALCSAALTALTGTFELADEDALSTTNDKSLAFRRVYDEVIFDQGGGGVDNATIVRQSMVISRQESRSSPESPDAQPWIVSTVNYEAWIDKDVTQDLEGEWRTIRSFVFNRAASLVGGNAVIFSEEPRYDYDNNRIVATMLVGAAATALVHYTLTVTDDVSLGKVFVPVWVKGRPLARYKYQGPGRYVRTVSETMLLASEERLDAVGSRHARAVADSKSVPTLPPELVGSAFSSGEWEVISPSVGWTPRVVGVAGYSTKLTEWTARTVMERIEEVGPTSGSATSDGGASATTPGGGD